MGLFGEELKITFKSLTYWVVIFFIGIFLFSQVGTDMETIRAPKPNQQSYDSIVTKDKRVIATQTITELFSDYNEDYYSTYPLGFVKNVKPSDRELKTIKGIIEKATGQSVKTLSAASEAYAKKHGDVSDFTVPLSAGYSYPGFERDMQVVSKILGKGSDYEKKKYVNATKVSMTYKQAKAEYDKVVTKDHVTGAYARIVCDYLGIVLALVPTFIGATVMLRDRRSKSADVIYTKSVSSVKLVGLRYVSTVLLVFVPVLVLSINPALQSVAFAGRVGVHGSMLLFFEYIAGWTLPTILAVVGLSFLLTELFGGIVAVVVQFGFFMLQMMLTPSSLVGTGWGLIPRFNTLGERSVFEGMFSQLVANRVLWSVVGLGCLALTIVVYEVKRKGGLSFGKKYQAE